MKEFLSFATIWFFSNKYNNMADIEPERKDTYFEFWLLHGVYIIRIIINNNNNNKGTNI